MKVELNLSNYVTKADSKMQEVLIHQNLICVDRLDTDKLKNVPTNLSNLKSKVDKLDVDKLIPDPVDLSKLSAVVKNYVVKKDVYKSKMKNIEDKIPDAPNVTTNTTLNAKINKFKKEIPSITKLATTTAVNAKMNEVKNKGNT